MYVRMYNPSSKTTGTHATTSAASATIYEHTSTSSCIHVRKCILMYVYLSVCNKLKNKKKQESNDKTLSICYIIKEVLNTQKQSNNKKIQFSLDF